MRKRIPHISWVIVFLALIQLGYSQVSISVKATVDRRQILIGEPIQLMLEATVPTGAEVRWFAADSFPSFEFVEKQHVDSVMSTDQKSYTQHFIITSFDSGSRVIPALTMVANGQKYATDSINIEVGYSKFDPKQDYHDIKDIIEVANPFAKWLPWIILAVTLIFTALLAYFITRKRRLAGGPIEEKTVSRVSPYEEAVQALSALKKQQLPESGQVKLYYTRLNDILRLFVFRKLQIASMEKTNDELILQLRKLNISNEQFSKLAQSLRMSDFVKFAKYLPEQSDNDSNFDIIRSSVDLLNSIEN